MGGKEEGPGREGRGTRKINSSGRSKKDQKGIETSSNKDRNKRDYMIGTRSN